MKYYKATRPDGTDFYTGTVNYAAALESGEMVVHHSITKYKDEPKTYLSVSISPSDCTGFSWPCRLFQVKPVGRTIKATGLPNKRGCSAIKVVKELPAHEVFGPNGKQVAAILRQVIQLTNEQGDLLRAAWDAVRGAAWDAARGAARDAARGAAWDAVRGAAWDAVWDAAWATARGAARDAALAYLVRDLITEEQFNILAGPWISVIGEPE